MESLPDGDYLISKTFDANKGQFHAMTTIKKREKGGIEISH
jgi:hypothetical protein